MKSTTLPVERIGNEVADAVARQGCAVITAPPGSGKSTLVPQFLLDSLPAQGEIIVLQPRRIAARSLAAYVARMRKESLGETVGYRVRFDARTGPKTRIIYQTYGVFLRRLLARPRAPGMAAVVLDEFHERTLEIDTALAWLRRLRECGGSAPRLVVMSATIDAAEAGAFLGEKTPRIEVETRPHPVEISYLPAPPSAPMERQACAALERLIQQGLDGSLLVFMPGMREIRRTIEGMEQPCLRRGLRLLGLHGSLDLDEQMRVMDAAEKGDCVIVSTNVAETSLTIPGVTAVIDSGWARTAGYDPVRERNTLYLSPISQFSATQRAGRAGRTAPGRCIRLWDAAFERRMPASQPPEIARLELSQCVFTVLGLLHGAGLTGHGRHLLSWLSEPETSRWERALDRLREIEAIDVQGKLTSLGEGLLRWPADPVAARILHDAQDRGVALLSCAAIALWEGGDEDAGDLFEAALRLAASPSRSDRFSEAGRAMNALVGLCDPACVDRERAALSSAQTPADIDLLRRGMALCWMRPLQRGIAAHEESGSLYRFSDGKTGAINAAPHAKQASRPPPRALIGLTVRESGGAGQSRRNVILDYLPLEPAWIAEAFPGECATERDCRWDERRRAVVGETRSMFRGLALERSVAPGASVDAEASAALLAARLLSDPAPVMDDAVAACVARIRCAAGALHHHGFPRFTDDDWTLIFHEFCRGHSAMSDLSPGGLLAAVRSYLGETRCRILDRCAPLRVRLPNGRFAKVRYSPDAPPALSARIGDLIGMKGKFRICEGRIEGVYDILAPNMRTVQMTADLDGFWKSTYPQIKRELQRRYPRHPWP